MEIWGSILTCSFKSTKMKLWQSALDKFLREQHEYLSKNSDAIPLLKEETGKFQRKIIQVVQVNLLITCLFCIQLMLIFIQIIVINVYGFTVKVFVYFTVAFLILTIHKYSCTIFFSYNCTR